MYYVPILDTLKALLNNQSLLEEVSIIFVIRLFVAYLLLLYRLNKGINHIHVLWKIIVMERPFHHMLYSQLT